MIITALDERNIQVAMDVVSAKLLVEFMGSAMKDPALKSLITTASVRVNNDGFDTLGSDTMTAMLAFSNVVGYWTRRMVRLEAGESLPIEPEPATPPATPNEQPDPSGEDEPKETPKKPKVN